MSHSINCVNNLMFLIEKSSELPPSSIHLIKAYEHIKLNARSAFLNESRIKERRQSSSACLTVSYHINVVK